MNSVKICEFRFSFTIRSRASGYYYQSACAVSYFFTCYLEGVDYCVENFIVVSRSFHYLLIGVLLTKIYFVEHELQDSLIISSLSVLLSTEEHDDLLSSDRYLISD
jgi:hypothetical protein